MKRTRGSLTLDEQLLAFLDKWDVARVAGMAKAQRAVERHRGEAGAATPYEQACRRLNHHLHEMRMLAELRRRAFPDRKVRRIK